MKKILFIIMLMCLCVQILTAQVTTFPWDEDFTDTTIPTGWVGSSWYFDDYAYTATNNSMLITPELQLPSTSLNDAMLLTYYVASYSTSYTEYYEVLVSTTGTNTSDFTVKYTGTVSGGYFQRSLNLSEYEGQAIYIAFQKTSGSYLLRIDDVWVGQVPILITVYPFNEYFTNSNYLQSGWSGGSSWTFSSGYAYTSSSNLLITPQLQLPYPPASQTLSINYRIRSGCYESGTFTHNYRLLVSTSGTNTTDFTDVYSSSISVPSYTYNPWMQRSLTLSDYEGQSIYIALQNQSGYNLYFDDIWIGYDDRSSVSHFPWSENCDINITPPGWTNTDWTFNGNYSDAYTSTSTNNSKLITPQLQLPPTPTNRSTYVTYKIANATTATADFELLVSTTGVDGTFQSRYTLTTEPSSSLTRGLNLTQYEGQSIHIAFQKTGGTGTIRLDDFWVGSPEPPRAFTATPSASNVTLAWQAPSSTPLNVTRQGYRVYRNGTAITNTITTLTYQDNANTSGTYYVTAVYSLVGEAGTAAVTVGDSSIQPPSNLVATPGPLQIALTWTPPTSLQGFSHYLVYRRVGSAGAFTPISGNVTISNYTNTGLESGVTYYYYVTAVFAGGESAPTTTVSAIPSDEDVLEPPENLVANVTQGYTILLSWEAPSGGGVTNYKVYRRTSSSDAFAQIHQTPYSTTLTYEDTNVVVGTTYQYAVTAVYPEGESEQSNIVFIAYFFRLPPTNLVAVITDQLTINLSWEAPASVGLQNYKVYRRTSTAQPFTQIHQTADTSTLTYTDTNVVAGTTYQYCVVGVYPVGDSVPSNTIYVVFYYLLPPTELLAQVTSQSTVALSWEAPESIGIQHYIVYRKTSLDEIYTPITQTSQLTFEDTQVVEGSVYQYYVTAVYPTGESGISNIAEVDMSPSSESDMVGIATASLTGNYPNPFNPTTTISFEMTREGLITIDVYNSKGQKIRSLVNGVRNAGGHMVVWDGHDDSGIAVSSGIYFYRMQTEGYTSTRKMLLMK